MKPLNVLFVNRIRELRKEAGISQEEFAGRCGFAQSSMSWIETGAANHNLVAIQTLVTALPVPAQARYGKPR
jgi:transcriptional regulator with XRE-family HTH domain